MVDIVRLLYFIFDGPKTKMIHCRSNQFLDTVRTGNIVSSIPSQQPLINTITMSSNPPNNDINELLRLLQQQQLVPQHQEQHQPASIPQINNQGAALPPDLRTSATNLMASQAGAARSGSGMITAPMAAASHLRVNSNDQPNNQQILLQTQQQRPQQQNQEQIRLAPIYNQGFSLPPGPGTSASLQNLIANYLLNSQTGAPSLGAAMGAAPVGTASQLQANQGAPTQALSSMTDEQQTLLKLSTLLSTINQSLIAEQVQQLLNINQQRPQDMMTNSGISQAQVSISDVMMKSYQSNNYLHVCLIDY